VDLALDETQTLLEATVRGFLAREVPFDRIRSLERSGGHDEALWRAIAAQGWLALPFAESLGGAGGSLVDTGILVEALARRAAIAPILEAVAAGRILQEFGGEAGAALVRALLAGEALPVPALPEPGRRAGEVALSLEDGRLSGEKTCVDYGQIATHHLVSARIGGEPGLCLVEAAGPGVRCEPLRSLGRTPVCAVRYERAPARPLGPPEALAALVRVGRALAAVQCVGSMAESLDATVRYAKVRMQFGRAIGSFQAVRHHAANMAIRVAAARLLAFEALSALDAGTATDAQVALAKASASRAAPEVLMLSHQIHGGNGVIEENDLYFFTLRGMERSLAWGSAEECLAVAAECVAGPLDWF
jgi:alkylation response protein AidB-like acyl-CoA dehydrogenase